ncbi:hypothetical protein LSH36_151g01044 [Paralvinella palmiformis]|uniref:TOG domain-containing protein n=1 Tax=Paralvinella palmiformis TaxID=53620 RepID=A0AAD9JW34_9ANNE|nr:hypothetical protein LSH36_151g01044 [Paralvinella palmiformis]
MFSAICDVTGPSRPPVAPPPWLALKHGRCFGVAFVPSAMTGRSWSSKLRGHFWTPLFSAHTSLTGKDESDFARPVGVPKGSKRFGNTGSAGMTGTLGRKAMGSKPSAITKRKRPGSTPLKRTVLAFDKEENLLRDVSRCVSLSPLVNHAEVGLMILCPSDARMDTYAQLHIVGVHDLFIIRETCSAGAVDEEFFIKTFEDVPKVHLFSGKEVTERLTKIKEILSDTNNDWEKRVEALREFRAVMIAGGTDYDEFTALLRHLEPCMVLSAKDLRSQVVREATVTLAYLSQNLKNKFDHFAEAVFPSLINLIPNSAKIMSTAGTSCIRFVIQHTYAPRIIPIITTSMSSKSGIIRRECCEFLNQLLHTWPTHTLERHIALLQEAIKKGIGDADSEARVFARKAFWGFADHFRDQADSLLNSLDASKQKMLQGQLSNSSSSNSLSSSGTSRLTMSSGSSKSKSRSRSMSSERSNQLYSRTLTGTSATARRIAATKTPSSGEDETGFRSLRQMKAYKQHSTGSGSADDLLDLGADRPRTLSAFDITNPQCLSRPKKKPASSASTAQSIITPERSRPRSKIGISQSQPSSRSGSPSSRFSYLTHIQSNSGISSRPRHKSGIPRSQGASRETSPNRTPYSRERRLSGHSTKLHMPASRVTKNGGNVLQQHVLAQGQDVEAAVADALFRAGSRRRYESYDSDDAASETSSVCSERSFSSYSKTSEDMAEIISNLSSGSWADRKEGLLALQCLLRSSRIFNRLELKKITEIFTRMFHDPHGKVFSVFMETLSEFVAAYRSELHDWLFVCLTRLINRMGADLLGSVQVKVQRALESVRESFLYDHQFQILNRFIVDQTQTPSLKVKVALLNYMHGLALLMDPSDFVNTSDTRLAVSRIITWTTEPKSVDVRKAAQAVLIALFNLNSPEFSMMLSVLPKTFQDGATRILHNHLRSGSQESEPLAPRNITSPTYGNRYKPSPNRTTKIEDVDTENMNPEDIYNSIKKTSADIQNLSKLDTHFDEIRKERDSTSQDSGIQGSTHDIRGTSQDVKDLLHRGHQYNPSFYQENSVNGYNKAALRDAIFDVDNGLMNDSINDDINGEQSDIVAEILKELSNHNTRMEERTNAMLNLIKITREGNTEVWDEHFKTILLLLLETLGDSEGHIRALALRVLREILRHLPERFKEYAELTILKILEAHKDPIKEVSRAAEECATTLAHSIPSEQCIRVLNPIIQTADYLVKLAAIKMQTKVFENADKDIVSSTLADVIPGLLQGYDNRESPVRKASVFCLVALYLVVGDELNPYVEHLSGSKKKLLNLYIKRSLAEKGQSGEGLYSTDTSKTTSPASTIADLGLA